MPIRTLLQNSTLYISITITILIAILSLIKTDKLPTPDVSSLDKIQHSFAYFVLTTSWLISKELKFKTKKDIIIIVCCFVFGIVIEALQGSITTYRSASFLDVVANSLGILLGFVFFKAFVRKKVDI